MKTKNRPRRQAKKRKNEYKKTPRGRKFNPWVYKYFDCTGGINDGRKEEG